MRKLMLCVVALLVGACGVSPESRTGAGWPAQIVGLNGFSESQRADVVRAIQDLNSELGFNAVYTDGYNGYPLTISLVSPSTQNPTRVGYAIRNYAKCDIELSSSLFSGNEELLKSVTWHEIGHCAGLTHIADGQGLMFRTTAPFNDYSSSAIDRFLQDFVFSAGFSDSH